MARLPIPGSDDGNWGDILNEYLSVTHNTDGTLKPAAVEATGVVGGATSVITVAAVLQNPEDYGGTYGSDAWTVGAFSPVPTSGDARLMAVLGTATDNITSDATTGLFEHVGSGVFERVRDWNIDDAGTFVVGKVETNPGYGSTIAWFHTTDLTALDYTLYAATDTSALEAQVSDVEILATDLETRLNRYYPANPVVPHLHVSKYVTFDPNFPIDGSATHVGGQRIDDGQNITILSNASGNGGVWSLSLSGPATRAQGFGAMVSTDIGNYDHVSYTGTKWAYFCLFRLIGDPVHKGLAPDSPIGGITGGLGATRVYHPDLIATTRSGDTLTVLNPDGSTTNVSISADLNDLVICTFVLDTLEMVTTDEGAIGNVEDFTRADGVWIAAGANGYGINTIVATNGQNGHNVLTVSPTVRTQLDDFEARISALETP